MLSVVKLSVVAPSGPHTIKLLTVIIVAVLYYAGVLAISVHINAALKFSVRGSTQHNNSQQYGLI